MQYTPTLIMNTDKNRWARQIYTKHIKRH